MCVGQGQGQGEVPMMKTFSLRVEKELPEASFTVTMSKAPGVQDGAHTARVAPLGNHSQLTNLELQDVQHLARSDIHL